MLRLGSTSSDSQEEGRHMCKIYDRIERLNKLQVKKPVTMEGITKIKFNIMNANKKWI